jgi:NADH dehydrogenase (ubiquinone) 1 beta subcomplex subunit 9
MFRYQAVIMRERFDQNRNIVDFRRAQQIVAEGEKELFEKQHYQPKKCMFIAN